MFALNQGRNTSMLFLISTILINSHMISESVFFLYFPYSYSFCFQQVPQVFIVFSLMDRPKILFLKVLEILAVLPEFNYNFLLILIYDTIENFLYSRHVVLYTYCVIIAI